MLIMPSFKKSLIVEQFQGNYLNKASLSTFYCSLRKSATQLISQITNVCLLFINCLQVEDDAHTNAFFVSLPILKFEDIIKLRIGKVR